MISEHLANRINEVSTQKEYDELMHGIKMSSAPFDAKDEAMRELNRLKPQFNEADRTPTQAILEDIKAGQADIDDIGGW